MPEIILTPVKLIGIVKDVYEEINSYRSKGEEFVLRMIQSRFTEVLGKFTQDQIDKTLSEMDTSQLYISKQL